MFFLFCFFASPLLTFFVLCLGGLEENSLFKSHFFALRLADERIAGERERETEKEKKNMEDGDEDNDGFFARPPPRPSGRLQLAAGRK